MATPKISKEPGSGLLRIMEMDFGLAGATLERIGVRCYVGDL